MNLFNWIDDRLEINSISMDITSKYVPPYVNIFYCFSSLVFTSFLLQIATSFAMTFYYQPSVIDAFSSIEYIMYTVNYGWFVRSAHRWSASIMILCLVLHIFRVYLTSSFKKPRELTWMTSVLLAVCTVSFGVTSYSLPYDQVSYWALRIVSSVPDCLPFISNELVELIRSSPSVSQSTLTRFYSLHTFVFPVLTTSLLLFHFLMIRKQSISGPL